MPIIQRLQQEEEQRAMQRQQAKAASQAMLVPSFNPSSPSAAPTAIINGQQVVYQNGQWVLAAQPPPPVPVTSATPTPPLLPGMVPALPAPHMPLAGHAGVEPHPPIAPAHAGPEVPTVIERDGDYYLVDPLSGTETLIRKKEDKKTETPPPCLI